MRRLGIPNCLLQTGHESGRFWVGFVAMISSNGTPGFGPSRPIVMTATVFIPAKVVIATDVVIPADVAIPAKAVIRAQAAVRADVVIPAQAVARAKAVIATDVVIPAQAGIHVGASRRKPNRYLCLPAPRQSLPGVGSHWGGLR